MAVLIDTNVFLALAHPRDVHHLNARLAMQNLRDRRIVVAPILPELFFMVASTVGYREAVQTFRLLQSSGFHIELLTAEDMLRMDEIMTQYMDNKFDFVDTALMAVAERLKITRIYTFDRRDFGAYRPRHVAAFDLLP